MLRLSLNKLLLVLHNDKLLRHYAILWVIWPVCASENERKINIRTISGTLGHTWLASGYVHIPEIRFKHQ